MGKVKQQYQDMMQQTEEELWDMLESQWLMQQMSDEAYAYEDSPNINDTTKPKEI